MLADILLIGITWRKFHGPGSVGHSAIVSRGGPSFATVLLHDGKYLMITKVASRH